MTIYPITWQVECDSCGNTARGGQGTPAQGLLVAAIQQGWVLQVDTQQIPPATTLLCPVCSANAAEGERVVAETKAAAAAAEVETPTGADG